MERTLSPLPRDLYLIDLNTPMLLTLAPMESLTGIVFRRRHHEFFGGVDRYYTPFVTPTVEPEFTERQMRELSPEANRGMNVASSGLRSALPNSVTVR